MRSSILSQYRDLSTGVICSVLRIPVTARAREFCSNWSRDILETGDSSVITRWTVHQEDRIKPMAEIKFCVTRALSPGLLRSFDKMGTGFDGWGPSHRAWT